jgi:hypothetical protein
MRKTLLSFIFYGQPSSAFPFINFENLGLANRSINRSITDK